MFRGNGVPQRLKGVTKHPIDVYIPDSKLPVEELLVYFENSGYEVQILKDPKEVSDGLPQDLRPGKYTLTNINVYLTRAKDLFPLATLARVNNCYVVHRLSKKVLKGTER